MLTLLLLLTACDAPPDTTDTSSTARECPYDADRDVCWTPLTVPGPSWTEAVTSPVSCRPFVVCPEASAARFALIEDYIEYAHVHFYADDGGHIASEYGTDEVDFDATCECDRRAMPVWNGEPLTDCPTWDTEIYALPTCPLQDPLTRQGELDRPGTLTGTTTWDDTDVFRTTECAGLATCGEDLRALVRLGVAEHISVRGGTRGIDVFDADGALVGTADVDTLQSWGTVPEDCRAPVDTTPGCGIDR